MESLKNNKSFNYWVAFAWIVPLIYPKMPPALYKAGQTMEQSFWLGLIISVAVILWGVSGPIASMVTLMKDNAERRCKVAIIGSVLATCTPPLFALTGVLAFIGGIAQHHIAIWYLFVVAIFLLVLIPLPEMGSKSNTIKKVHLYSAIPVGIFATFHLFNTLSGIISLSGQNQILLLFRSIYRSLPIEFILLACTGALVISGIVMALKSFHSNSARTLVDTLSGLYLAAFFLTHLTAVLFLGRSFLKVDTNFIWASGGEPGLLVNPYYTYLPSYYFLAVVALFIHFGHAVIPYLMKNLGKDSVNRRSNIVSVIGVIFAIVCTAALCGYHISG